MQRGIAREPTLPGQPQQGCSPHPWGRGMTPSGSAGACQRAVKQRTESSGSSSSGTDTVQFWISAGTEAERTHPAQIRSCRDPPPHTGHICYPGPKIPPSLFALAKTQDETRTSSYTLATFLSRLCKLGKKRKGF